MKALAFLLLSIVAPLSGVDTPTRQVAVEIVHEKGSFNGQLSISVNGSMNKAKTEWNTTIRNTSDHKIFRVTLCIHAFDTADQLIKPPWKRVLHNAVGKQLATGRIPGFQRQTEHQDQR